MSHSNKLYTLIAFAFLLGCKPRAHTFDYTRHINKEFFGNVQSIDNQINLVIDSVHVYTVRFIEILVEKDGLLEYKLFNEASAATQTRLKEAFGNSQQLYFFRLFTQPSRNIGIYLSVKYNGSEECIGFGPAYFGHIRMNQVNIDRVLRIKNNDEFLLKDVKKYDLYFECDRNLLSRPAINKFIVHHILQDGVNKIGGHKDLVFDINEIFNDPGALEFKFKESIRF